MNSEQFDQLSGMADANYGAFVHNRRHLIGRMIDARASNQQALRALQTEIDCRLALAVTPSRAIDELMVLLIERVAELRQLSEQLHALPRTNDCRTD